MKSKALVIDDDLAYRADVCAVLEAQDWDVLDTNSVKRASAPEVMGYDLVILDNRSPDSGSYWKDMLPGLRLRHPTAWVLLVSHLTEQELQDDVAAIPEGTPAHKLLDTDPWLSYLPKGDDRQAHLESLGAFAGKLDRKLKSRKHLQRRMIDAAMRAAQELHATSVSDLVMPVSESSGGKGDTKAMDVIAERHIHEVFLPVMHDANVVICTEERGSHNRLFHRVQSPDFYVFSDPFDGSSAFKLFVENILTTDERSLTLGEVIKRGDLLDKWRSRWGSSALNAPMVSIVVGERHAIVGAILINLYTNETYVSVDSGNWWREMGEWSMPPCEELFANTAAATSAGWMPVHFSARAGQMPSRRLLLCTLQMTKKANEEKPHYRAAELVIKPLLSDEEWQFAKQERSNQHDFTPGPGRVLFLSDGPAAQRYYQEQMPESGYEIIASAGEPLTEWMGWFAFLRHVASVSAFCLRPTEPNSPAIIVPKKKNTDPSSMMPEEVLSIFRSGYIDLAILHSAYANRAPLYKDTFVVVWDSDLTWRARLYHADGREKFVRIPLHNQLATCP